MIASEQFEELGLRVDSHFTVLAMYARTPLLELGRTQVASNVVTDDLGQANPVLKRTGTPVHCHESTLRDHVRHGRPTLETVQVALNALAAHVDLVGPLRSSVAVLGNLRPR